MTAKIDKLPILFSCRVRLNEDQRQKLKDAYYQSLEEAAPPQGARIGASSVSTVTTVVPVAQRQLPGIVISDLLGTRESIPLTTLRQLEKAFNTQVITKAELLKAAEGYIDYLLDQ